MSSKGDKRIKEILNNNIKEIPKEIDDNIEKTLKKLKRKKSYKKIILIASTFIICILSLSIKINANKNEVRSDIFDEFGVNEEYSKYAIEVNKVAEEKKELAESSLKNDAIEKVKIESLIYDGYTLTFGYECVGEEVEEAIVWNAIIDGKEYKINSSSTQGIIDNGSVRAICNIEIFEEEELSKYVGKNADDFEITLFTNINGSRYEVKEVIRMDTIKEKIREASLNLKVDNKTIKKLIVTPMNIYIFGYGEKNTITDVMKLKDSNGVDIMGKGLSVTSKFGIRDNFIMVYENKNIDGIKIIGEDKQIEIKGGEVYEEEN